MERKECNYMDVNLIKFCNTNGQCIDGGFLIPNKDSYDLLLY